LTGQAALVTNDIVIRLLLLSVFATTCLAGCEFDDEFLNGPEPQPTVVYVQEPKRPVYYDPYYNRPKVYRDPVYFESTNKKTKGNKVYKTTTIRNEYGRTVYKETTSKKKKKK
jgi:hypothetical protein